jgi:hypothetical protein
VYSSLGRRQRRKGLVRAIVAKTASDWEFVNLGSFIEHGFQYPESDHFVFLVVLSTHLAFQVASPLAPYNCSM